MKAENIVYITLLTGYAFVFSKTQGFPEDGQEYHYPSKSMLNNILRESQSRSVNKFISGDINGGGVADTNHVLNQFLNRFQPALDRENKRADTKTPLHHSDSAQKNSQMNTLPDGKLATKGFTGKAWVNWPTALEEEPQRMKRYTQEDRLLSSKICTKLPGKVMCKYGQYTYVFNTKEKFDDESLDQIVNKVHKKVQDGDKSFDVSISSPIHDSQEDIIHQPVQGTPLAPGEVSPVMVECTAVKSSAPDRSNDIVQTTFSCKSHSLKLKRETKTENVLSAVKAKTCSTPLSVRKFSDVCTHASCWCPCTTLKPCPTTPVPPCVPWCNPFLKEKSEKIQAIS